MVMSFWVTIISAGFLLATVGLFTSETLLAGVMLEVDHVLQPPREMLQKTTYDRVFFTFHAPEQEKLLFTL